MTTLLWLGLYTIACCALATALVVLPVVWWLRRHLGNLYDALNYNSELVDDALCALVDDADDEADADRAWVDTPNAEDATLWVGEDTGWADFDNHGAVAQRVTRE